MSPRDGGNLKVYDPESSRLLATGVSQLEPGMREHPFCCLDGNGTLLVYYFGRGKREVTVQTGPNEGVTARLGTRWVGGRREWILNW